MKFDSTLQLDNISEEPIETLQRRLAKTLDELQAA